MLSSSENSRFKGKVFHGRELVLVQSLDQAGQLKAKCRTRGLEIAIFEFSVRQVGQRSSLGQDRRFDIRVENPLAIKEGDRRVIRFYPQTVDNFVNKIGDSQVLWGCVGSRQAVINQVFLHCLSAGYLYIWQFINIKSINFICRSQKVLFYQILSLQARFVSIREKVLIQISFIPFSPNTLYDQEWGRSVGT